MGLFSRKTTPTEAAPSTTEAAPRPSTPAPAPAAASASASASADAPLVSNTLVQAALLKWGEKKNAQTMNEVLRQCATGDLLIDVSGSEFADISQGLQPGDTIGVGQVVDNAGKRLLLVFTDNEAVQAYRPEQPPMSLAQPASGVMQQALSGYDGVVIDPANPNSCIIYNTEIQLGLTQEPGFNEPLKTALGKSHTVDQIRELVTSAPLIFIGVAEKRNDAGEVVGVTLPAIRTTDGEMCALAFTSPAEVWAFDATLSARPTGLDNVIAGAKSNGQNVVMLNPMGPWAALRVPDFDL